MSTGEQVHREGFLEGSASPLLEQSSLTGMTVGAYTLQSPIGEGGMGSVWLASRSDGRYDAKVAVKLLKLALVGRALRASDHAAKDGFRSDHPQRPKWATNCVRT